MPEPLTEKPEFAYDVFLSHNKEDAERVRRLAQRLTEAGLRVWFDEWAIGHGDDIYIAVERGLEESRTLILCMSSNAFGSGWVELERVTPLFRIPTNTTRRFIPLLLSDCDIPETILRYKFVDYRDESDAAFQDLLRACRAHPNADSTGTPPESRRRFGFSRTPARTDREGPRPPWWKRHAKWIWRGAGFLLAASALGLIAMTLWQGTPVYRDVKLQSPDGPTEVIRFRLIPAGRFEMGSNAGDADERPRHPVNISRAFYLSVHEITQRQYGLLSSEPNYSGQQSDSFPVDAVRFEEAAAFCNALSRSQNIEPYYAIEQPSDEVVDVQVLGGRGFRLPTEAEWEYACRAGTTTRFSCGDDSACLDDYAWHESNAKKTLHSVGTKLPNPWGLYDMHGNVLEWCQDWYDDYQSEPATDPRGPEQAQSDRRKRVVRGGAYYAVNISQGEPWHFQCRCAFRHPLTTNPQKGATTYHGYGFRVAQTAD